MSTETWILDKGLCRCCHAKGKFKSLTHLCEDFAEDIIYADLLKDYLNIDLGPVPGVLCLVTYTICDECITKLCDAVLFKKDVEACERKFKELFKQDAIKVQAPVVQVAVKEEIVVSSDDDTFLPNDDNDTFDDNDLPDDEYDVEEPSETVKDKPEKVPRKSKSKKQKKIGRPKKMKEQPIDEEGGEKRTNVVPPKFRLAEGDYTVDGDMFLCARCDKKYDKYFSLRVHVKTKHYKIPRHKCTYCNKEFMTLAPLTLHKLEEHNVDDRFKCNACTCSFNTKGQLRKHKNSFHMLGERFSCQQCDYECFSFEGMYKHKFKHKTSKDQQCRFCKKAFVRKTTLKLHERIHTGDRRKVCTVCGQAFVQKASLNYHMTKYHPEVNF